VTIVNAMSVDVEDYFHVSAFQSVVRPEHWRTLESRVERNTERLLAIFSEANVRATFFVLGWVAEQAPGLVRAIAAEGHEIASHGYGHELLYRLRPRTFRDDLRRARGLLEDATSTPVIGYRAPSFSVTARSLWALEVLAEEGYRYDASVFPIYRDRYGIPSAPRHGYHLTHAGRSILEIPASTVRLAAMNFPVSGGGYFRLLPYAWTRWAIARVNTAERKPVVFYLHPWELDPDQPRLPGSRVSRFRHYVGLRGTEARLRRLLADFRFAPVATTFSALLGGPRVSSLPDAARAGAAAWV
jgi:polysaccharide deacetylase family protein (PEP-CTERM system associated)